MIKALDNPRTQRIVVVMGVLLVVIAVVLARGFDAPAYILGPLAFAGGCMALSPLLKRMFAHDGD
jgi:hypothetical protein